MAFAGGAINTARSAMSSWFTSLTTDWKNQEKVPPTTEAEEAMEDTNESNILNETTPESPKVEQ